jgi:hypothetical protein
VRWIQSFSKSFLKHLLIMRNAIYTLKTFMEPTIITSLSHVLSLLQEVLDLRSQLMKDQKT